MPETTEKLKKTKAPAKPRAQAADGNAPAKKTATSKAAASKKSIPMPSHEEISRLAEQYWRERGHQDGHAEQDWLRAEQELMKRAS